VFSEDRLAVRLVLQCHGRAQWHRERIVVDAVQLRLGGVVVEFNGVEENVDEDADLAAALGQQHLLDSLQHDSNANSSPFRCHAPRAQSCGDRSSTSSSAPPPPPPHEFVNRGDRHAVGLLAALPHVVGPRTCPPTCGRRTAAECRHASRTTCATFVLRLRRETHRTPATAVRISSWLLLALCSSCQVGRVFH